MRTRHREHQNLFHQNIPRGVHHRDHGSYTRSLTRSTTCARVRLLEDHFGRSNGVRCLSKPSRTSLERLSPSYWGYIRSSISTVLKLCSLCSITKISSSHFSSVFFHTHPSPSACPKAMSQIMGGRDRLRRSSLSPNDRQTLAHLRAPTECDMRFDSDPLLATNTASFPLELKRLQ